MRRRLLLCWIALLWVACSDLDPGPLYVDMDYQVRCVGCTPQAIDNDPHDIMAIDGEQGLSFDCNVVSNGDNQTMTFMLSGEADEEQDEDYEFEVSQVRLGGRDPGPDCRVTVTEGPNEYRGSCTRDDPTEDDPCRVRLEEEESGVVTGTVLCENIPNRSSNALVRHVVAPESEDPVEIEIHGCTGL